ncbi:hypothetical protein BGZ89_009494 [Linnemannia elongata]|nr:hypothetical protein BGZ89_009494 [Linnemannia elongata]
MKTSISLAIASIATLLLSSSVHAAPIDASAASGQTGNTSKGYVQITGRIDRSKYGLSKDDGGGQYDLRAPVGSKMTGYNAFVQLTEPDAEIFCIRACKNKSDCPVNKSTYGCEKVLGGDYS